MQNKIKFILAFFLVFFQSFGQVDSVFHFESYIDSVLKNHPLAVKAGLVDDIGIAKQLKSRGAFDPKAQANVGQKYFDEKKYYSVIDAGFKFPTWLGIDIKAGYEQNIGINVNPESQTPNSGLVYAGVEIPIGKGLFMDQRRLGLKQADIFLESTEVQQKLLLNTLILEASYAYWSWYQAYHTVKVYRNALNTAEERYSAVRREAFAGDRPYIDTVEAGIQVQNRQIGYQEAQLNYKNASAQLSVFLWLDGLIPIEITSAKKPPSIEETTPKSMDNNYSSVLDTLIDNHPELVMYDYKLQSLDLDRKWAAEQLKPELNLRYNPITSATQEGFGNELSMNNYKWGVSFSMPLILRKERGELQLAKLKIQETKLDQLDKTQNIKFKANAAINDWETAFNQLKIYANTVDHYQQLFQSEITLFQNGESNLFMVNSREVGFINTQIKYIDLQTKNAVSAIKVKYHLGVLFDEYQ